MVARAPSVCVLSRRSHVVDVRCDPVVWDPRDHVLLRRTGDAHAAREPCPRRDMGIEPGIDLGARHGAGPHGIPGLPVRLGERHEVEDAALRARPRRDSSRPTAGPSTGSHSGRRIVRWPCAPSTRRRPPGAPSRSAAWAWVRASVYRPSLDGDPGVGRLKRTGSIVRQGGHDLGRDVETSGLHRHQAELPSGAGMHARRRPEPLGEGRRFLGGTGGITCDEGELGSERDAGTTLDDRTQARWPSGRASIRRGRRGIDIASGRRMVTPRARTVRTSPAG